SFLRQIDGKATHVPYNGTMASLMDVVAGRIPFSVTDLATSSPLIKKGELIALAVPSDERSPVFPNVPTFKEAGTPLVGFAWHGVVVPKGTPPEIIAIINKEILDTLKDPATAQRLRDMGT